MLVAAGSAETRNWRIASKRASGTRWWSEAADCARSCHERWIESFLNLEDKAFIKQRIIRVQFCLGARLMLDVIDRHRWRAEEEYVDAVLDMRYRSERWWLTLSQYSCVCSSWMSMRELRMYWLAEINLSSGNVKSNRSAAFKSSRGTSVWTLRHEVNIVEEGAWGSHHLPYVCRLWSFLIVDGFWATRRMDETCAQRWGEFKWDRCMHWLSKCMSPHEWWGYFWVFGDLWRYAILK